jgi:ubiquinone/menaquinone biosynthesis C-methylase UbiE
MAMNAVTAGVKTVLHVGCGQYDPKKLHIIFRNEEWREIRLDIDPSVNPDIVGDMTRMDGVPDASVDAIWSSHNIEHLYWHEVLVAFKEFQRVLKPDGFVYITLPDIQAVAKHVAEGNLEDPLYESPSGPICAIDILYGHRPSLRQGYYFMAHKTGFSPKTLGQRLHEAGFQDVQVESEKFNLWAVGYKRLPAH